jgi:flagellar hook-associated protein 2
MAITIDGISSGLDTESIVKGLLEIQQLQIDRLTLRKQDALNKQAVFQSLEAQVTTFRSAAARLARPQNNVFEARNVSVSDENALVATAGISATPGVYQISVESLAQAHQIASQGFTDADAQITQGTFTIRQGSRPAVDITIDSTNDTLQGLADAINLADTGVSASIIQDGSSAGTPARILLSSSRTGEANAISITNNLAVSAGGAVNPAFDFGTPVQAAANAAIKLGSGAGALTIETAENQMKDVIAGVTLDLVEADPGKPITVRVQQDPSTAVGAVQEFVDAYNSLVDFAAAQSRFESESGDAGLLLGDRSLIQIESELQNALQTIIPGVSTKINRLSTIGITVGDTGKLSFNSSKLSNILNGEVEGVKSDDVRRLFALDGNSNNANIQFILGSTRTRESSAPVEVNVTQAAERASITGTNSIPSLLAGSTTIDSSNNTLTLNIDNAELTVALADGTYTDAELATELESIINAHPDGNGRSVSVGLQDNGGGESALTVTSNVYGGSSQVTIKSGTAMADLGLTGIENDQGIDVEGHYIVNGVIEAATGRGRVLSGDIDNENTADLQVRITMTASQIVAGSEGEITVTRGFASRLDQVIGNMVDSETGVFKSINDRFTTDSDNTQASIDRQTTIFKKQEQDLLSQFVALETALSELQSTQSFLTQQFANLSSLSSKK